jgi:hypothetical protein
MGHPPARHMVQAVVDPMATLAEALQIAQPVVGPVMIEMGSGQNHPDSAHPEDLRAVRSLDRRLRPSRQVRHAASNQRPLGRQVTILPCGRPHGSHTLPARSKRTKRLIFGQSTG